MFEIFLHGLITALIRSAIKEIAGKEAAAVFRAFTLFDDLLSITDVADLGLVGFNYGYEELTEQAIDHLVHDIKNDEYDVELTKSGVYVARSRLIPAPRSFIAPLRELVVTDIPTEIIPVREIQIEDINRGEQDA